MKKSLLLISILMLSCGKSGEAPYVLPVNAFSLMTADSSKTWKLAKRLNDRTRMNMGDCFLSYRQIFRIDSTMNDNNGDNRDCGKSLQASWKFVKDKKGNSYLKLSSEQIPELLQIDKDYKFFKVLHLSEKELTLQFSHKQFSGKSRIITDHYVTEDVVIEDRDFHW